MCSTQTMGERRHRGPAIGRLMAAGTLAPGIGLSFRRPPEASATVDDWIRQNPPAGQVTLLA